MKIELKNVKNAFKYVSIALAIIIMVIQFYCISSEFNVKIHNLEPIVIKETSKLEYCEESGVNKFTDLAFKSIMAFFAGCLFSERKFIRVGII